jgi:hypothetical protein
VDHNNLADPNNLVDHNNLADPNNLVDHNNLAAAKKFPPKLLVIKLTVENF